MATLAELESAFIAADDAGNHEDAKAFADGIRRMRSVGQDPFSALADRQRSNYQARLAAETAADASPSPLGSFAREAVRSVGPGLAGFGSGAASGAGLGAMGFNPVTIGIGAIGGGILGAMGARKAQDVVADAVAPDSFMGTASAAQDFETNPISSLVGGAIAQGRPGPMRVLNAGRSLATAEGRGLLASSLKAGASSAAQTALGDVVDVGLGAGIGGGMSLASGDGMALENAAIGALFNRSWIGGAPPSTHAPIVSETGLVPVQPEVIRGPVIRMGNGEIDGPFITRVMPMRPALPAPERPAGLLPAPAQPLELRAPADGARQSPPVTSANDEASRSVLINTLEDEFVQNRARREKLSLKFKDDNKPLNSGDGRKMINILDARAKEIESRLSTLRGGEIIAPPATEFPQIVEVDNRPESTRVPPIQPEPAPISAPQTESPRQELSAPAPAVVSPDRKTLGEQDLQAKYMKSMAEKGIVIEGWNDHLAGEAAPSLGLAPDVTTTPEPRRYARAGSIETTQPDFVDFMAEHRVNIPRDKSGGEHDGFREWHQSLPPLYKSERHFSTDGGSPIDTVAQAAFEAGHIDAPDTRMLMDKYSEAIAVRKRTRTTGDLNPLEIKARALEMKAPRQAREFDTALVKNRRSRAGEKVLAGELAEGETFEFDGERFKVTKSDTVEGFDGPEGLVVIQDHDRFGTQVVDASQPLRIAGKDSGPVWQHEADRAHEVLSRRQPADEAEFIPAGDDEPSFLKSKTPSASPMDVKNQNSRELFPDDGGFSLSAEATEDGTKVVAAREGKEAAAAANDAAQGGFLDALKAHRANVDRSIQDGRGKTYMTMTGISPTDVKLIYRAALDVAISTIEAGQSVTKAVKAALAHIKQAAPRLTTDEAATIERRLYAEANDARRFGSERDAKFKVEMPKIARELEAQGVTAPSMGQLVKALTDRFPDQASFIRKNADRMFDEMIFSRDRMTGKSAGEREWSEWLDAGLAQASKVTEWAKKGTPFRDIADKLYLFNRTYFGTIGAKMHALADGRLNGKASPAFQKFVNEFVGLESGAHGVHRRSLDQRHEAKTKELGNKLDTITARLEPMVSKLPKGEREAFFQRVTDHITDPARDGELARQPELKRAVDDIIALRKELYDMKIKAGVDMGNAGPRSMPRRPDAGKILGNEKEFIAQAAKAYQSLWAGEIRELSLKAAAAKAAGDTKAAAKATKEISEIRQRSADDFAKRYLYAVQSDDIGISADGNGDLFTPHNGNPSTEKSRVFGPEADQFLGKFYERNALELMRRDITDSTRAAAIAEALSSKVNGEIDPLGRWKTMRAEMEAEGNRELIPLAAELIKNYFNLGGRENPKVRRVLELAHAHTQIGRLSHAMLASLGEPVNIGMRHGGGVAAMTKAYLGVAKSLVRRLRSASPSEWQIIADFMGATTSGLNSLLTASRHMEAFGGRTGGKLVSRFHVLTMLTDFTNATHELGIQMGHAHILGQLQTAKAGGKFSRLARKLLNEVGISGGEIDSVLTFAKKLEAAPDKAKLLTADTPEARKYRDALHLFRDSGATLEPTRGTRPEYANTPLGTVFYQLSSFLYNFHEKVTKRSYRHLKDAAKGSTVIDGSEVALTPAERAAMTKNVMQGFVAIAAAQYGIQQLRETLLADPVRIQKDKDRSAGEKQATKLMSAASRTGIFGPYDMLFNMITGARFQRDPATAMLGPAIGGASELFGNTVRLLSEELTDSLNDRTAPRSNMTARKLARSASDMIVTPAISAFGATVPGRILGGAIIQGASSPAFRETFTRGVAGPMRIDKWFDRHTNIH